MPTLIPGGELTYLGLYGELSALGFSYGRDFARQRSHSIGWHFVVSDAAYQAWIASKGAEGTSATPPATAEEEPTPDAATEPADIDDVSEKDTVKPEPSGNSAVTRRTAAKKGRSSGRFTDGGDA